MKNTQICVSSKYAFRPTWSEINTEAIKFNLNKVKEKVGPGIRIMGCVKANAYGHGLKEISLILQQEGIDYLGVACLDEAIVLREEGIAIPILIFNPIVEDGIEEIIKLDLTQTVYNFSQVIKLSQSAKLIGKKAKVHIEIDTGMGRLGIWYKEAIEFIRNILQLEGIFIEGIYTHFPDADRDIDFTHFQIKHFMQILQELETLGVYIHYKHAANSAAIFNMETSFFNMVRPGLMLYGVYPNQNFPKIVELKPAFSLKTKIVFLKQAPPGRSISYGRTYITKKHTRIATLPIGYGDGYSHLLSNKAEVIIGGKRCPVIGRVCMDQIMVDVGSIENVSLEDEVVLIGRQDEERISVEELANLCNTISYQILCWISPRVPRVYIGTT